MGKKKKKAGGKPARAESPSGNGLSRRRMLLGSAGIVGAGLAASVGFLRFRGGERRPAGPFTAADLPGLPRRETRPTLPPGLFVGKAAAAYAVARETPPLLDQLYCYCQCQENHGHLSLLTCYVDYHASR